MKQLEDYQKKVEDWRRSREKEINRKLCNDERNTTVKFIIPLLNILDWNHLSRDMEFEHRVQGRETKRLTRVDIALYTEDSIKPKIFVEIKRIEDELGTGRQVLRYLHAEGVKYGIYTNGREIRLLDNRTPTKYAPEGLFCIRVGDFVKYHKVLDVLSKESIETGKLDKLAECYHSKNFWDFVKKKEREIEVSKRKELKYGLRLDYAKRKL